MRIKHPTHVKGQLYIPMINLAMYIGVVIIILLFRDSSHMEAAYGLAITITMLMTTLLLGFYLHSKGVARIFTIRSWIRWTYQINLGVRIKVCGFS